MDEAAYEDAKAKGELIQQRLRKLAESWAALGFEASITLEAAETIEWYEKRCDSLIDEVTSLRSTLGATPCQTLMLQETPYSECFPFHNCEPCHCWRSQTSPRALDES